MKSKVMLSVLMLTCMALNVNLAWGAEEILSQTLEYDTWTYSGSTTKKSSYRLFHSGSYIESAEFDLSTLSKVVVYGGTFGGDSYNELTIGDGTNTWKSVTVSGSSQTGVNTYTDGTPLSGKGKLRITSNSGTASSNGVRISKIEIYTSSSVTYTDYLTECVSCNDPGSPLAFTNIPAEAQDMGPASSLNLTFGITGGNGEKITYKVSPETGVDLDSENKTLTFTDSGTYTLTATQPIKMDAGGNICGATINANITITKKPVFNTATIDKPNFDVTCGDTTSSAATITLGENYNLTKTITVTASDGFLVSTNKDDKTKYAKTITLTPTAAGKITNSVLYVRSYAEPQSEDDFNGTIKFEGTGITTQTLDLSANVTCPKYTLTFMDRGGVFHTVEQYAGAEVIKPESDPMGVCTEPTEYIFDGWATENVTTGSTTYTKVTFPYTMPNNNTTKLYAVYRYPEAGDVGWKLVTDLSTVAEGTYALLSTDYVAFNGSISSGDGQCTTTGFTFTDGVADAAPKGTCEIKMIASSDGYLMYNADNGYLYAEKASSGNLAWSTTVPTSYWKYGGSTNNNWIYNENKAYLRQYNGTLRTYSTNNGDVLQLAKKGGSYLYTSDPACGPHIGLSGDVRITSAKGVRVDAYTKITVSGTNLNKNTGGDGGTATAVSIKAESNNPNFKIKRWRTTGDGTASSLTLKTDISDATYADSLCITYTPTTYNAFDTATITLTAYRYQGTTPYATKTITVLGHSLPERFVIAAKGTDGWVALPNTLGSNSSAKVPNVEDINGDVDDSNNPTKLTTAPSNVIYTAAARGDSYKNNSQTGLRFTVDGGQFLQASKNETEVWLSTTGSQDMQSWTLRTEDFVNYQVRLDSAEEGRYLAYDKNTQYKTERIGHYKANTAIRFLPFEEECTRLLAPANLKVTQVKSSAITLAWDAVAGAIGYAYSTDGGSTWTEMGNVLTYTITGLTAKTPYTIWVKGVPSGATDCSYYETVLAKTTNCDDVPYDISYTSDVNSITLSWTMTAGTATVQVFSNADETGQVDSDYTGATSPYTITGLTKATTYYVKILADGSCPSALVEVSTERPQLDVVEWKPNGIDVAINTNEKISVILENQVTKGTGTGQVANELFFSKYYEATGNVKLIAIYNGTLEEKDLRKYRISIGTGNTGWTYAQIGASDWEAMGKTTLQSNEELVLYYYVLNNPQNAPYDPQIIECVNNNKVFDFSTAYMNAKIMYSGRQNFLLEKTEDGGTTYEKIDLMGAMNVDGTNLEPKEGVTGACVPSWGDITKSNSAYRTWCGEGPSIDQYEVDGSENIISISMNRCLLIRKKTVLDGYNAVAKNIGSFYTLGGISETVEGEWLGRQVEKGTDNGVSSSCAGFEYVGGFDYNKFYTTYNLLKDTVFDDTKRNPDGTMTINIPRMDTLACKGLKIIAKDKGGNVLTTKEYRVPILVTRDATTADPVFFHFGGDTCKTCDVVVRDKATLTKAEEGTPNDKPQVRDVKIYEGASLVVPSGRNYTVNSLSLRRKEDAVSTVDVAGTLTFSNTSGKPVYLDLRINAENWHWFTLPYDCAIADVTWSNGQPAEYGTEWFLMDYDGKTRAATQTTGSNWKEYEGTTIAAGQGFIVGIKGDGNDKHAYELRFPMAKEVITDDSKDKKVEVYAYGAGTEVRPNHKGWNLVGNPYLNYYQKDHINSFRGLRLGLLEYHADTGWWSVSATDSGPYIVIPQNFGWSAYKQVLVSSQDLLPFTSYFIQVGKDKGYTDGQPCEVQFTSGNRGKSAKAALMTSAAEEAEEEPVITGIVLRNAQGEQDETSLVIAERFGSSYEMGADFFKWFGDYYKYYTLPVLYSIGDDGGKRAFNAVNEEGAKQSIPLGMYAARDGQYTFSLNTRSDLSRVDKVWLYDAESGRYTDLLREDYSFATTRTEGSGRFFLSVVLKEKEITTSAANARYGDLTLYADKQTLVVRGLPEEAEVWVYDPSGKLLHHEQTRHYERQYEVPQQGTYLVRVESQDGGVTLRGVCR